VLAAFGFFCFGAMGIKGPAAPATALAIAGAMVLVAFGLMIVRRDVASQAIGFLALENAISLAAMPPSGIFRSEFQIVDGGLGSGNYAAAAVLIVLVTVAFFGLTASATRILFTLASRALSRSEPSIWMVIPVVAGVAVLFILGLHPPAELTGLIYRAAAQLGAAR
jgi:formate hydrogenlyase subunit 3/multisubunit Na+/H+ antiporter MnhD subunit